jgi:hypothetical protein
MVAPARGSFLSSAISPRSPDVVTWPKVFVIRAIARKMVRQRFSKTFFISINLGLRINKFSIRLT